LPFFLKRAAKVWTFFKSPKKIQTNSAKSSAQGSKKQFHYISPNFYS